MENFDQIFTLIANREGIGLNLDILETGLINIIALVAIVVSFSSDFLSSFLEERKSLIIEEIQSSERSLNEAQLRFNESKKKLKQANLTIRDIKITALKARKILLNTDVSKTQKDLKFRFERALKSVYLKEKDIVKTIKFEITTEALNRADFFLFCLFSDEKRSVKFMNNMINILELPG